MSMYCDSPYACPLCSPEDLPVRVFSPGDLPVNECYPDELPAHSMSHGGKTVQIVSS